MVRGLRLGLLTAVAVCTAWWVAGRSPVAATSTATPIATPTPTPTSTSTPISISTPPALADEPVLMARLRAADAPSALALVAEGNRRFPAGVGAEEREARRIDALVALDRIGEAHSDAMAFVQRYPSGPFSAHVINLMGVHPRPPGALPAALEQGQGP